MATTLARVGHGDPPGRGSRAVPGGALNVAIGRSFERRSSKEGVEHFLSDAANQRRTRPTSRREEHSVTSFYQRNNQSRFRHCAPLPIDRRVKTGLEIVSDFFQWIVSSLVQFSLGLHRDFEPEIFQVFVFRVDFDLWIFDSIRILGFWIFWNRICVRWMICMLIFISPLNYAYWISVAKYVLDFVIIDGIILWCILIIEFLCTFEINMLSFHYSNCAKDFSSKRIKIVYSLSKQRIGEQLTWPICRCSVPRCEWRKLLPFLAVGCWQWRWWTPHRAQRNRCSIFPCNWSASRWS